MKNGKCPKCGSSELMSEVPIIDNAENGAVALGIYISEPEPAKHGLIWQPKGAGGTFHAWICASCGYTELYTNNLPELYESYKKGHA